MSITNRGDAPDPLGLGIPDEAPISLSTPALRAALQAQLRARTDKDSPVLLRLAAVLCTQAHRRRMRAEELIVLLKQTWMSLPESALPNRLADGELVEQLISLCIEEYFRAAHDSRTGSD